MCVLARLRGREREGKGHDRQALGQQAPKGRQQYTLSMGRESVTCSSVKSAITSSSSAEFAMDNQ
jgi:hypothetical protein